MKLPNSTCPQHPEAWISGVITVILLLLAWGNAAAMFFVSAFGLFIWVALPCLDDEPGSVHSTVLIGSILLALAGGITVLLALMNSG